MFSRHPALPPTYAVYFDPGTIAAVAFLTGGAVSAVGAIRQGQAADQQGQLAQQQANLQAQLNDQQADVLDQQAQTEIERSQAQESDFRREQSRVAAARRAAGGASGVVTGTGSSLLVDEDFATEVELQALRLRAGGVTSATRLQQQAGFERFTGEQSRFSGAISRQAGRQARIGGVVRGGASLLTGIGQAFGSLPPRR